MTSKPVIASFVFTLLSMAAAVSAAEFDVRELTSIDGTAF